MKGAKLLIDGKWLGRSNSPISLDRGFDFDVKHAAGFDPGDFVEPKRSPWLWVHIDGLGIDCGRWEECLFVLWPFGQSNLPNGYALFGSGVGRRNSHWLSGLAGEMKSWTFRRRVVKFLIGRDPAIRRYIDWYVARGARLPDLPHLT